MLEDSTLEVGCALFCLLNETFSSQQVESGSIYLRMVKLQNEDPAPYRSS